MSTTRRSVTSIGAATLLAAAVLAGCAEEEPTTEAPTSTSSPSDDASSSSAPDDMEATTGPSDSSDSAEQTDTAARTDEADATEEPVLELAADDDAFSVTVPATWEDVSGEIEESTVLLAAKETERIDAFFTNIVVTEEEYVANLTSAVEDTAAELAGEDGEYELLEAAEVDGNLAPGYTLVRQIEDSTVHQTQRWVSHDGTLYVVTLSAVESQSDAAALVLQDMLASWTWND